MDKKRNKELMTIAEEVLQREDCPLYIKPGVIHESYNGQVSALGVSTLMIGLKATFAVYYSDRPDKKKADNRYDKAYRKLLLDVIVKMINKIIGTDSTTENFVREVMKSNNDEQWKRDLIDCSVALKQVIRTYKLENNDKDK